MHLNYFCFNCFEKSSFRNACDGLFNETIIKKDNKEIFDLSELIVAFQFFKSCENKRIQIPWLLKNVTNVQFYINDRLSLINGKIYIKIKTKSKSKNKIIRLISHMFENVCIYIFYVIYILIIYVNINQLNYFTK